MSTCNFWILKIWRFKLSEVLIKMVCASCILERRLLRLVTLKQCGTTHHVFCFLLGGLELRRVRCSVGDDDGGSDQLYAVDLLES